MTFASWLDSFTPRRLAQKKPPRSRFRLELLEDRAVPSVVNAVDDGPGGVYTTNEDTALVVSAPGVLSNDTTDDPSATLSVTAPSATSVYGGSVSVGSNGSVSYSPASNFFGTDTFSYTATSTGALGLRVRTFENVTSDSPTNLIDTVGRANALVATGQDVGTASFPFVDFRDNGAGGNFPHNFNPPGLVAGVDYNDFVVRTRGTLTVNTTATYTFVVNSDAGGRLRFDMDNDGIYETNVIVDNGTHAVLNRFSTVFGTGTEPDQFRGFFPAGNALTAGQTFGFEYLQYERGGGNAAGEFGYSPTLTTAFDSTFKVVGDSSGGLTASDMTTTTFKRIATEINHIVATEALINRDTTTQVADVVHSTINFHNSGGGGSTGNFAGDAEFPGIPATPDQNNFAIEATGAVFIPSAGTWTFVVNSDDGFAMQVLAHDVGTSVSLTGVVGGLGGIPAGNFGNNTFGYHDPRSPGNTFGQYNFGAPGWYNIRLTYFEREGSAEVDLAAAPGALSTFSSAFQLVGDTANGGLLARTSAPHSDTATVSIAVAEVNDAPVCVADNNSTTQAVAVSGNVLTNDSDPDNSDTSSGDPAVNNDDLDAMLVSGPSNGTLAFNTETGAYTYTPDTTFSGTDSFTYRAVDDPHGATSGACTVTITVTPADTGVQTVADTSPGGTALLIVGTTGNDQIVVNPGNVPGTMQVSINGTITSHPAPTGRIIVIGDSGDDNIQIAGGITNQAWLYGDGGADHIYGGGGASLIFGGGGDDQLLGGSGRDILVGGAGADRLIGNSGDDLLIAGLTTKDSRSIAGHEKFWGDILKEWTSSNSFQERLYHLSNGMVGTAGGTALNNGSFLDATTLLDDSTTDDIDLLQGCSGLDWIIFLTDEDRVNGQ